MANNIDKGLYAAPLGMIEAGADTFAGAIPTILKINSSNSLARAKDNPNQAITGSVGDALRHPFMHGGADGFIEFALFGREGDAAQDGVLGRQFGRYGGLGAAEDEGADARGKLLAADRVAVFFDGRAEAAVEGLPVAQQARHQEGELRPQLTEVVLDRRAGHPADRSVPQHSEQLLLLL